MHSRITAKVEQEARSILGPVRKVLLGLSGGADSVALFRVLLRLGVEVVPVHCNFHLRGAESDRDMAFCEKLCEQFGLPLDIIHFDVVEYERKHHVSTEVACRELRYAYFRDTMRRMDAERVAVAHHADDNIETMFLNLFRGSGIRGLRGMLPDAHGIIRPLLTTTRTEILEYLKVLGQDYVTDSTNLESDYRRNYIRNELLPSIETRFPGARKAMTLTIGNLRSDDGALEHTWKDIEDSLEDPDTLPYKLIKSEWMLHRWLSRYGCRANIAREIAGKLRAGRPDTGKRWQAAGGWIIATRTALHFEKD